MSLRLSCIMPWHSRRPPPSRPSTAVTSPAFCADRPAHAIVADVRITAGPFALTARFERAVAPRTCDKFASMLPYRERLIHVRWSGEACWIPLGDLDLGLSYENATSYP